jgi:hypothetical protein
MRDDTPFAIDPADGAVKPEMTAADPFVIDPAPFPAESVVEDRIETPAPVQVEAPVAPVAYVNPMMAAAGAPVVTAEPAEAPAPEPKAVEPEKTLEPAH